MMLSTLFVLHVALAQDPLTPAQETDVAEVSASSTAKAGAITFGIAWGLNEAVTLVTGLGLLFGPSAYSGPQLGAFLLLTNSVPVVGPLAYGILLLFLHAQYGGFWGEDAALVGGI